MSKIELCRALDFVERHNISPTNKMLLLKLMQMQEESGAEAVTLTYKQFGLAMNVSARSMWRHVGALEARGIVTKIQNRTKGRLMAANSYIIVGWKA